MHTQTNVNFGTASQFGTLTGWIAQDASVTITEQLARVLDTDGNEAGSNLYDKKTDVSQNFKAGSDGENIPSLNIGGKHGNYIVTSITVNTTWNDFATISLTGHNHDVSAHTNTLAQADYNDGALDALDGHTFGACEFLGATAGNAVLQNSSMTIACQHVDHNSPTGNHAIGENYDCVITVNETWHGQPTSYVDSNSSWKVTNIAKSESNTDFETYTVTAQMPLALSIPA